MLTSELEPRYAISDIWVNYVDTMEAVILKGVLVDTTPYERGKRQIIVPDSEMEKVGMYGIRCIQLKHIEGNKFWANPCFVEELE